MRPPEVFVRELAPEEGARLKQVSRKAKYQPGSTDRGGEGLEMALLLFPWVDVSA